jgi:hypothetical protein
MMGAGVPPIFVDVKTPHAKRRVGVGTVVGRVIHMLNKTRVNNDEPPDRDFDEVQSEHPKAACDGPRVATLGRLHLISHDEARRWIAVHTKKLVCGVIRHSASRDSSALRLRIYDSQPLLLFQPSMEFKTELEGSGSF